VVAYDYGCGAHSDATIDTTADHPSATHAFDTTGYDEMELADAIQSEVEAAAEPESDDELTGN
jgi:hypothetical protein